MVLTLSTCMASAGNGVMCRVKCGSLRRAGEIIIETITRKLRLICKTAVVFR